MRKSSGIVLAALLLLAACGDDGSIVGATTTGPGTTTSGGTSTSEAEPTTTTAPATTTTAVATTTTAAATTTTTAPPVPVVTPIPDDFVYEGAPGCAGIEVTVTLPEVSGLAPALNDRINARLRDTALDRQNRFLTDAYDGCDPALAGDPPAFIDMGFEATTVRSGLLSIRFFGSDYFQGSAHPNAFVFTLSFNPVTGDLLSLDSILVPGGVLPLAAAVEQRVVDDLYAGDIDSFHSWVPAITPDMLTHWVVSAAGIEVSFDPYLIGPGAMGAPTVVVPFAELVGVIDPGGPAGPS